MNANTRTVRLFLSSTFRDFGEERDLLVKRVFPALRARLKDRFVELVDVDLRWGVTGNHAAYLSSADRAGQCRSSIPLEQSDVEAS